jgi:uncharacterized protein (TIGR02270 family)
MMEPNTRAEERYALLTSTRAELTDHYTELIALGWRRRAARLTDPTLEFADLLEFDGRLEAALRALLLLGRRASEYMRALVTGPLSSGDLFALTWYAAAAGEHSLLEACRDLAVALPDLQPAFTEACTWAPASPPLRACIDDLPLAMRLQVMAGRHGEFDGMAVNTVEELQMNEGAADSIRALCGLIRSSGRGDLLSLALSHLDDESEDVVLCVARTVLTVAPSMSRAHVLQRLGDLINSRVPAIRVGAVQTIVLHQPQWAPEVLRWLARKSDAARLYLSALGWAGQVDAVPVLMEQLGTERHGRVAGASLALIVGSDPARDGWLGTRPAPGNAATEAVLDVADDSIPETDPDANLPWPDRVAFDAWWNARKGQFSNGIRYLAGRPVERDWLSVILMSGPLAWRPLAAEHRQCLAGGTLFPVDLRADVQRSRFAELAS